MEIKLFIIYLLSFYYKKIILKILIIYICKYLNINISYLLIKMIYNCSLYFITLIF